MKKKFMLPLLLLTLCTCLLLPAKADAASKSQAAKNRYHRFIQKKTAKDPYKSYAYKITDINGDKVPELLLTWRMGNKSWLYTYNSSKDKVKKVKSGILGKSAPMMYYSPKRHLVCFFRADTGGSSHTVYKYTKKNFKKQYTLTYYNGKFNPRGYLYNGKKLSDSQGQKKLNAITKKMKKLVYLY